MYQLLSIQERLPFRSYRYPDQLHYELWELKEIYDIEMNVASSWIVVDNSGKVMNFQEFQNRLKSDSEEEVLRLFV